MIGVEGYEFSPGFERCLIAGLLNHPLLAVQLKDILQPKKLKDESAQAIVTAVNTYAERYGRAPVAAEVESLLSLRVAQGNFSQEQVDACSELLADVVLDSPMSADFLRDEVVDRERRGAVWTALRDGTKRWLGGDYKQIAAEVMSAATLGEVAQAEALDLFDKITERTATRSGPERKRYPTMIPEIDGKIRGGLAAGELGCILGAAKHGKSQFLGWLAFQASSMELDVAYFSFEMGVLDLADRFDACISGIEIDDLRDKRLEVEERVADFYTGGAGRIYIEQFPAGAASTRELDASLRRLRAKGVKIGMVITDYGDLMIPEHPNRDNKRHEALGDVYTDLRRLAGTWNVPLWTASQATREALEREVVTMMDVAESFKKVQIVDLLLAICGTAEERAANCVRVSIAACRFASGNATTGTMQTLFAKGRFVDASLFTSGV